MAASRNHDFAISFTISHSIHYKIGSIYVKYTNHFLFNCYLFHMLPYILIYVLFETEKDLNKKRETCISLFDFNFILFMSSLLDTRIFSFDFFLLITEVISSFFFNIMIYVLANIFVTLLLSCPTVPGW